MTNAAAGAIKAWVVAARERRERLAPSAAPAALDLSGNRFSAAVCAHLVETGGGGGGEQPQPIVAIATAENMPNGESDQLALPPKRKKKGTGAGARRK